MSPNSQKRKRGGDEESATTQAFFFEILYHFYRIFSLYSWQVSQPPLSEFSGSPPAYVCKNVGRKVDNANLHSCLLCHALKRKTKQISQWRWKLVKATSAILSHLLPATETQGSSLWLEWQLC